MKIKIKRSNTAGAVPSAVVLEEGELAANLADKKIFSKDSSGNVVVLADVNAAATSETAAAASATAAASSATNAAASATAAASSATDSASSAADAESAKAGAEAALAQTLAAYDNFDDRYLGAKSSDPSVDNDGNVLLAGSLYYNTVVPGMKVYNGSAWVLSYAPAGSFLQASNNLSELTSASTARSNLGLTSLATTSPPSGALVGTTDTQSLTNKTLSNPTITDGYTEESISFNTGTSYTVDLANGTLQIATLTDNCTYTFPTPTAGKSFVLLQKQDGTGSRTATWPSSVKWPANTAPTLTATASKGDKFVFNADGTYWWGSVAGQNYL
jgi:hypothetical protein